MCLCSRFLCFLSTKSLIFLDRCSNSFWHVFLLFSLAHSFLRVWVKHLPDKPFLSPICPFKVTHTMNLSKQQYKTMTHTITFYQYSLIWTKINTVFHTTARGWAFFYKAWSLGNRNHPCRHCYLLCRSHLPGSFSYWNVRRCTHLNHSDKGLTLHYIVAGCWHRRFS